MTAQPGKSILSIVIPALNEEDAIGSTIQRCLDDRQQIIKDAGIDDLEVIVVSDGSTDKTAEIAKSFSGVKVIEFEHNRGYGAAIKAGFAEAKGDLLSFLDADGTCDPKYFGKLARLVAHEDIDIALGSRLGKQSQMPLVRRIGNRIYALLTGLLTGRSLTDSASGMRVMSRSCFNRLSPLPDGLHFTPAMSARALVTNTQVAEVPMKYSERIGASKLHVMRDGVRFLRAILGSIFYFRPERLFLLGTSATGLLILLMGIHPTEFYMQNRRLEEWMIYRFMACFLLALAGYLMFCSAALSTQLNMMWRDLKGYQSFWAQAAAALFQPGGVLLVTIACFVLSTGLLWPGIVEYATSRTCSLHWSRLVVGGYFIFVAVQTIITGILMRLMLGFASNRELRSRATSWQN